MTDVLVQLSDLHVQVGDGAGVAAERVERAIELVRRLDVAPSAILLSGDIANDGGESEHARAVELLAPLLELGPPVLPMVGNHDDRARVRESLGGVGNVVDMGAERHLQYAVDVGSMRILVLDTQHTGHADGKLCDTRHAWLVDQLESAPDTPTILAMHHPPVAVGMPRFDAIGMRADHADRFHQLLLEHAQVELVTCGHVHRPYASRIAHAAVFGCPSVFWPAEPDLVGERPIRLVEGPVGIGVHVRTAGGAIASHVRMIGDVPGERRPVD